MQDNANPMTTTMTRPMGNGRFFTSQIMNFNTLRVIGYAPTGGADTGEILYTTSQIAEGDVQGWYASWTATAQRVLDEIDTYQTSDPTSKALAYMKAYNYFETGEFLLPPDDPKRPHAWKRVLDSFDRGIELLGVPYERFRVPYPGGGLRAIYFPGPASAKAKPLVMIVGGYDSTMEELYFILGQPALTRGYSMLIYEGPGQGDALRNQHLYFLPEWEQPNGAVLDEFLHHHKRPEQIILVGVSMGGYFAPRAAAFDDRIDGVVAFDACYDFGNVMEPYWKLASNPQSWEIPDFAWAFDNFRWTMGLGNDSSTHVSAAQLDTIRATADRYTLAPVAARIKQPVLILAGAGDTLIPHHQSADFAKALVNAKRVTTRVFDRASGGAEHCQNGNMTLAHAAVFSWIQDTFGD